jgi:hypothetical protein
LGELAGRSVDDVNLDIRASVVEVFEIRFILIGWDKGVDGEFPAHRAWV